MRQLLRSGSGSRSEMKRQASNSAVRQNQRRRKQIIISRYTISSPKQLLSVKHCLRISLLFAFLSIALSMWELIRLWKLSGKAGKRITKREAKTNHRIHFTQHEEDGVSLVASCKNGHERLRKTLPTWMSVDGIREVVVIDWDSDPPLSFVIEEVDRLPNNHPPLRIIHVRNESKWVSSRAFNVGFGLARYSHILKVQCDNDVGRLFLKSHPLPSNTFYTGSENLERSDDEKDLRNILLVSKQDLLRVGGYDERLQEFGGEQDDLVNRLTGKAIKRVDLNYDSVSHRHLGNSWEYLISKEVSGTLEKEVNLQLLQYLPKWASFTLTGGPLWTEVARGVHVRSFRHANVSYISTNSTNSVPSVRQLCREEQILKQKELVVNKLLFQGFGLSRCFADMLTFASRRRILEALMDRAKRSGGLYDPKVVAVRFRGDLPSRALLLTSSLSFAERTGRLLIMLWDVTDSTSVSLDELFVFTNMSFGVVAEFKNSSASLSSCSGQEGNQGLSSLFYSFVKNSGILEPAVENDREKHIFVEGDLPLKTMDLRLVNEKSMKKQFEALLLNSTITTELQKLFDLGLRDALGIYVSQRSSNRNSLPNDVQVLTAILERVRWFHMLRSKRDVFYYGPDKYVHRLKEEDVEVTRMPFVHEALCNETHETECQAAQLLRILAFKEAGQFFSPIEDGVSAYVKFIRNSKS